MASILYEVAKGEQKYKDAGQLDHFRLVLEPYIYMHLSSTYGPMLEEHWKTYTPPTHSKNVFVIVERRPHPNFSFVLKNMAWACPHMAVYLFCSHQNRAFIDAILGEKAPYFHVIEIFTGEVSRELGKIHYNNTLTDYTLIVF